MFVAFCKILQPWHCNRGTKFVTPKQCRSDQAVVISRFLVPSTSLPLKGIKLLLTLALLVLF
jgi:hypothetical protein